MGGLFSSPETAETVDTITTEDASLEAQKAIAQQKKRERRRRGYTSTILASQDQNTTLLGA